VKRRNEEKGLIFDLVAANLLLPMLAMLVGKEDKGTGKLRLKSISKTEGTPEILKRRRRGDRERNAPKRNVIPKARSKLGAGRA
jgi:hypothetical protein